MNWLKSGDIESEKEEEEQPDKTHELGDMSLAYSMVQGTLFYCYFIAWGEVFN